MKPRYLFILPLCIFLCATMAQAQNEASATRQPAVLDSSYLAQIDSIMRQSEKEKQVKEVKEVVERYNETVMKKEMSFSTEGIFPLLRGLIFTGTEHGFIKHKALFSHKDEVHKWNDYAVGGAPLAATWLLKAAGVNSRSKTERMLTANAMALGISFGASQLLKHTVSETRPDMSDDHSFPSGHATLAFASATILSREYGYLSPWITVGGYATATGTQLLRMQHNRHWINDLYTGAGIGMVGTNLAYFLTDKIFGADGINRPEVRMKDLNRAMRFMNGTSGLSFLAGTEVGNRKIEQGDAVIKVGAALSTGFDATWSVTPSWSLDIMTRLTEAQTKVYSDDCVYTGDNFRMVHVDMGGRWSVPMGLSKRVGLRAFMGMRMSNSISMSEVECHRQGEVVSSAVAAAPCQDVYAIPSENKFECGAGMTYECLATDNYVFGFVFDYFHTFSDLMPNRYSMGTVWKILF